MEIHKLQVPDGLRNHPSRNLLAVQYITIHETGNFNTTATAEAHARFQFTGGGGRQASWHYSVDEKEVWQSFRDEQMCWHTGTQRGNERSIGIEICVNNRAKFLAACKRAAMLTAELLRQHDLGISQVIQHHGWSGKNCPAMIRSGTWGIEWPGFLDMIREEMKDKQSVMAECQAQKIITAMKESNVRFDEAHWLGVLTGDVSPNMNWTKILTGRIIEARWGQFSPEVIGSILKAMLGQKIP